MSTYFQEKKIKIFLGRYIRFFYVASGSLITHKKISMLPITLESQKKETTYKTYLSDEFWFELKVVNESLFPEIRISFKPKEQRIKNKSKLKSENISEKAELSF